MPSADLFKKLGLYVEPKLFSAELCEEIAAEMQRVPQDPLRVVDGDTAKHRMKLNVRRTKGASVSDSLVKSTHDVLQSLIEPLRNHFGLDLSGCEQPQFLVYTEGDYFKPHSDSDYSEEKPQYIRDRKLSVIVFVTGYSAELDGFQGGELVFHGLLNDPRGKKFGFPLRGEAGMCIAFPSNVVHEVTPIAKGKRCTIVSWFY
jgi:predicted 2-oxoglutarate/Fe(II)-dependent dioxygenase YbiX